MLAGKFARKLLCVLNGEDRSRTVKTSLVNIGNYEKRRLSVLMKRTVDSGKAHRSNRSEQRHFAALYDTHLMLVAACLGVIHSLIGSDYAAVGLCKRAVEIGVGVIFKKTIRKERFKRDISVLRISAALGIGISGSEERALVIVCGLN